MNSNLRHMIEDALDGELSHEETYSYNSDVDMSQVYGHGEIEKLASALNYVATNLDDLGTTDEKLAELELLQEKLASGETKAVTEAADDTLGAFAKNLKGDSGKSLGKAFGELSTARKVGVGGAAGLIGLGALYGGYKMLGGGNSQPNTQVVKVSSLQDAKAIALTKMAQRYDIPVHELEKIALTTSQGGILGGIINSKAGPGAITEVTALGDSATKDQIANYKKYQQQMTQRQRTAKTLLGETGGRNLPEDTRKAIEAYGKGGAMDPATAQKIRYDIASNPTASSGVIQSGDRVLGQRKALDATGKETGHLAKSRNAQGKIVPGNFVEAVKKDGTKVKVPAQFRGITPEKLEAGIASGKINTFEAATGDTLRDQRITTDFRRRQQIEAKQQAIADQRAATKGQTSSTAPRDTRSGRLTAAGEKQFAKEQRLERKATKKVRGAAQESSAVRNRVLRGRGRNEATETFKKAKVAVDKVLAGNSAALTAEEISILEARVGKNYEVIIQNAKSKAKETATKAGKETRSRSGVKGGRQANVESAATQGRRTGGAGKAATEAGEKELGFLAKNRRALLGAGALGAAGLAGYGAYKALGGGGQSKAASFRGMRKLAEDRINPARIKGGRANGFSGMDIHAHGTSRSAAPVAIKAQRIRNTINQDMQGYVSNTGGGYNLSNYLNKFNK